MSLPPSGSASRPLIVIGTGGAAREVAGFAGECLTPFHAVALVDHDDAAGIGLTCAGLPVMRLREAVAVHPRVEAVIAIGSADIRRRIAADLQQHGVRLATLVHRSVYLGPRGKIGEGTIIAPGSTIMCDTSIGANVYINIGCTVSHDTIIEDFATLSPGVSVPGTVHIENGAFIGTGASFVHGKPGLPLRIGRDAVVGAGACVTADVKAGQTVVGVPARPVTRKQ